METSLGTDPSVLKAEGSYWTAREISAAATGSSDRGSV